MHSMDFDLFKLTFRSIVMRKETIAEKSLVLLSGSFKFGHHQIKVYGAYKQNATVFFLL